MGGGRQTVPINCKDMEFKTFKKGERKMKKQMQGKRLTTMMVAGLLAMATTSAYAYPGSSELVAEWNTSGMAGTEASLMGTGTAHISAVELTRGAGLAGNTGANSMNTKGWDATNSNDYLQFSLTVESGYTVTLGDLWIGTKSSGTGPGTMGFYSSADNYVNAFHTVIQDGTNYYNETIDLSFLGPVSGSFAIRLYEVGNTQADGSGDTSSTGTFRVTDYTDTSGSSYIYHNIGISGSVAPVSSVPVPAAAWLLGTGFLGLIGLKRKKK